jgi:hypothetical protein
MKRAETGLIRGPQVSPMQKGPQTAAPFRVRTVGGVPRASCVRPPSGL